MKTKILALTMGDPGGIGPEILVKTLRKHRLKKNSVYLAIGAAAVFQQLKQKTGLQIPLEAVTEKDLPHLGPGRAYFLDISERAKAYLTPSSASAVLKAVPGRLSKTNAAMALASIDAAARLACTQKVQAIVTAPLSKTAIRLLVPGFHGHTEFLAQAARVKKFAMMFVSPHLKITLVTIHVPLSKVSGLLTRELILEKIILTHEFLKTRLGFKNPRMVVCAVNPHGRETGTEEDRIILPAVRQALRRGIRVEGPVSADRVFFDAKNGLYDAVISMYHDQALAPFKMISFYDGVNTTLGLPFVRTSPDHGTAFDIAYQNKADASSMQASLNLAEQLTGAR